MNDAAIAEEVTDEVETDEVETEAVETEEVAEDATEDESPPNEESSASKKEESDKVQKRIDEITRIRREEERQRIAAEQENKRLRDELEQLKPKQPAGMKLADFEYDENAYQSYLTDQATEQAKLAVRQQMESEKQLAKQAEFSVRETDYASENEDYQKVTRNPELKLTRDMLAVAQGSEHGPAVLYHLGKNPDIAERLSYMSTLDMAREMGRIEAQQELVKRPPSITKAPAPPTQLKAAEKATTIRSDTAASDKLSADEWRRREMKRLANKER